MFILHQEGSFFYCLFFTVLFNSFRGFNIYLKRYLNTAQRVEKVKYQISTRCETSRNGTEFRFLVSGSCTLVLPPSKKRKTPTAAEIRRFCGCSFYWYINYNPSVFLLRKNPAPFTQGSLFLSGVVQTTLSTVLAVFKCRFYSFYSVFLPLVFFENPLCPLQAYLKAQVCKSDSVLP